MGSHRGDERPHLPSPSLWPVGFAVGIACLLVGLVVSWPAVAAGAAIALLFGFLWVRDVTGAYRGRVDVEPETREVASVPAPPARAGGPAQQETEEIERFPRSKFLEGATLGLGAAIGGIVTVPSLGFAIAPAFIHQRSKAVDLGPITDFTEGEFVVATFLVDPDEGEISRRTAYIRSNGLLEGQPSFTIVSNRCVHLGCPVQPNGPLDEKRRTTYKNVSLIPVQPAGFGCPCHGGQYDTEGNRTAGPPVRALDRYSYSIRQGHLWLDKTYSVAHVDGEGSSARIKRYRLAGPGQHVDGPEAWFYPLQAPH